MKQNLEKKAYASPEVELVLVEAGQEVLQASSTGIQPYVDGETTGWF